MRLADGMRSFPEIHIPVVDDELLGPARPHHGLRQRRSRSRRPTSCEPPASIPTALGTVFIRAIIKQVLVDGFFHGDPHPGNVLVDPASARSSSWTWAWSGS